MLFEDKETAEHVLKEKDPRNHKQLGRRVQNFEQKKWDANCVNIVKCGNMAKFSQNKNLYSIIKKTHPKILVEASPYDRIWGIGLSKDDPKAQNRNSWKGKNLLGQALTEVRDYLIWKKKEDPNFVFSSTSQNFDKSNVSIVTENGNNDANQDSTYSKETETKACTSHYPTSNDSDNIVASQIRKNDSPDSDSSIIGEQTASTSPAKCETNQNIISSGDQPKHQCQENQDNNSNIVNSSDCNADHPSKIPESQVSVKDLPEHPFQEKKVNKSNPVEPSGCHNAAHNKSDVVESKSDIEEKDLDENTGKPIQQLQQVNSVQENDYDTKL